MKEKISWFNEIPAKVFLVFSIIGTFYFYGGALVLFRINDKYEGIVYGVYLFSLGISVVNGVLLAWKYIKQKIAQKQNKKDLEKKLSSLDKYEKDILCKFFDPNRNIVNLDFTDATVQGLLHKKVLINVTLTGNAYQIDSYLDSIIIPDRDLNFNDYKQRKEENKRFY